MDDIPTVFEVYLYVMVKENVCMDQFLDCCFIINGEKIKAHKSLLGLQSPVFKKMFYGSLATKEDVEIVDIDASEFKQMLEYVYRGFVTINSLENAWNLYAVGDKYMLNGLIGFCTRYIGKNMTMDTLALSYDLSCLYGNEELANIFWDDMMFYTKGILFYDSHYHLKLTTFCRLLEESISLNNTDLIHAIIVWTINECNNNNNGVEPTKQEVVKVIKDLNLLKYVDFSQLSVVNTFVYTDKHFEIYEALIRLERNEALCKTVAKGKQQLFNERLRKACYERPLYKIASKTFSRDKAKVWSNFETSREIILFGMLVSTEHKPPCAESSLYNGAIGVTVFGENPLNKAEGNIEECLSYNSTHYLPLNSVIVLKPNSSYSISITYSNFSVNSSCVLLHYLSDKILEENETRFTFHECSGSVIRGLCYYLA